MTFKNLPRLNGTQFSPERCHLPEGAYIPNEKCLRVEKELICPELFGPLTK
jgi:hypothetical protein